MDTLLNDVHLAIRKHFLLQTNPNSYELSDAFKAALDSLENDSKRIQWKSLMDSIRSAKVGQISDETVVAYPAFCASIRLYSSREKEIYHTRKIYIFISLIGGFYTIFGQEDISILDSIENECYHLNPLIYCSPYSHYESVFSCVRSIVNEIYSDYRFVPFNLLRLRVPGLSNGSSVTNDSGNTIFQALFSLNNITDYKVIGDVYYE